jgi:hypothetical protein
MDRYRYNGCFAQAVSTDDKGMDWVSPGIWMEAIPQAVQGPGAVKAKVPEEPRCAEMT